ncbi:hypothetical protein M8C21_025781 [Ambrosia artemisiifolia]|uniref:Uncharacterized protein n=1 Tax=Ambrosia artemisiifolia TaxID=4212 RepID=A0AAD5CEG0_AMBAR|nr:hypothetical protein M8C21_025781 [Ambrosia artemisiifolia]
MTEAEYFKFKDPKQPIGVRIKDLMKRMTLEEKIGQMTEIDKKVASNKGVCHCVEWMRECCSKTSFSKNMG